MPDSGPTESLARGKTLTNDDQRVPARPRPANAHMARALNEQIQALEDAYAPLSAADRVRGEQIKPTRRAELHRWVVAALWAKLSGVPVPTAPRWAERIWNGLCLSFVVVLVSVGNWQFVNLL